MAFRDIKWAGSAAVEIPYGEYEGTPYKARSALSTLYASDYGYDEWKNIGIAFKAAGGEKTDWLAWCAIDASNYDEKLASKLFDNVDPDGPITAKYLYRRAWDNGWTWHERYSNVPAVKDAPEKVSAEPSEQAVMQLSAMFELDEFCNIVTKATKNNKGKWVPSGYGKTYLVAALLDDIRSKGLEAALGGYNHEAGVWVRVNPMDDAGISDSNVARFASALVESDDMPLKDQERMLLELELPIRCITASGGKSIHAVVAIDAEGREHYRDRVEALHRKCESSGMTIDKANRNPSRLTRLAGVERGQSKQELMHLHTGARDFRTWLDTANQPKAVLDFGIEPLDTQTPVVLAPELVDGMIRRGDKVCITGASKSFKSFNMIEFACALATGDRWLGHYVHEGRVLYVNCELRAESFRARVLAVMSAMHLDPERVAANFDVWNMRGRVKPLRYIKERIIEQVDGRGYDAIILDPIYKLFDGDENAARDVSDFMLMLEELGERSNATMFYVHHHSKGAKGDVAAQDRASGSGVFARDADVLIDISALDLGAHSPTEYGRDPQATALRAEFVLRDFAPIPPMDMWFEYPLHEIDRLGDLAEFKITNAATRGGNARGKQQTAEAEDRAAQLAEWLRQKDCDMLVSSAAEHFGRSPVTIKNWVQRLDCVETVKFRGKSFLRYVEK